MSTRYFKILFGLVITFLSPHFHSVIFTLAQAESTAVGKIQFFFYTYPYYHEIDRGIRNLQIITDRDSQPLTWLGRGSKIVFNLSGKSRGSISITRLTPSNNAEDKSNANTDGTVWTTPSPVLDIDARPVIIRFLSQAATTTQNNLRDVIALAQIDHMGRVDGAPKNTRTIVLVTKEGVFILDVDYSPHSGGVSDLVEIYFGINLSEGF